jgi:hypothetical protein
MNRLTAKIKPAKGFAQFFHIGLLLLLPILVFVMVRLNLVGIAVALIVLSKWRMFAVKPRHWPANIRANAIDIIVGLSFLVFMIHADSQTAQLVWTALYAGWLVLLKPRNNALAVSLQAIIGQVAGLSALFLVWGGSSLYILVILAWVVCYSAARHFLTSFDEPLTRFLSYVWGYFGAALTWLLGHWLLFYGVISQPTLILSVIGFGVASLYYLEKTDKLSSLLRRQIIFIILAIIVIVLAFSNWGDKAI